MRKLMREKRINQGVHLLPTVVSIAVAGPIDQSAPEGAT